MATRSTTTKTAQADDSKPAAKPRTRRSTAKSRTESPVEAANQAAIVAPAGPVAQSPEGQTVEVAHSDDKYAISKRADMPVYEVRPRNYEGPAPLVVSVADWADFKKAVASVD